MAISLLFSVSLYQVSIQELDRGLRRPGIGNNIAPNIEITQRFRAQFDTERIEAYERAQDRIITNLVLANIAILLVGGIASYYLALRTLKPIEDSHEAQSRFAANASHELRTPITAMRSENEVALMDPDLTLAGARKQLQSNIEELEKLTRLSEGLLRLAQLENTAITTTNVAINDVLHDSISRVTPQAHAKKIHINSPNSLNEIIDGDPVALTEMFVTILDNAVKYSADGSKVTVSTAVDHTNAIVTIADTGKGIAEKDIPHIFDRFYQADSSRTKYNDKGYGLGLSIAQGIADIHHAKIDVISKVGSGSTFSVTLPIIKN